MLFSQFIFIIIFLLALQIPLKTYHSGAYAITRIIHPAHSMIIPEIIGLLLLISLVPYIKQQAIIVGFWTSSILAMSLTYHYSCRMEEAAGNFLDEYRMVDDFFQ